MANHDLWKYCTRQHCHDMLLSFHLFENTDIAEQRQINVLYALSNGTEKHYHKVFIPKRDGSLRQLLVPDGLLKQVQVNILRHLLEHIPVSSCATAYRKGYSVRDNAEPHNRQPVILKLDIKDFFNHIIYPMVYREAFPASIYPPPVRSVLAHLCCYCDKIPQGAPTSAALANIVMRPFDEMILNWCNDRQIIYTRYCDDLTFSGNFVPAHTISKVKKSLAFYGFELNEKKTRILTSSCQQSVTGIVVNDKVQCSRHYRQQVRQAVYYCQQYGADSHIQHLQEKGNWPKDSGSDKYLFSLLGKVNYILQINPLDTYFMTARQWLIDQLYPFP